jgi:hypothetical protein
MAEPRSAAPADPTRIATATALTPCSLLRIRKAEMVQALHRQHELSDLFGGFLLARNARIQMTNISVGEQ